MEKSSEPPFDYCPTCGMPQIANLHHLVLYYPSAEACKEAVELLKAALPQSFEAYDVDGKIE